MFGLAALCLLVLQTGAHGFDIFGSSWTHQKITEKAILNATFQVCRSLARAQGKDLIFPPQPFTAESTVAACEASKSTKSFLKTIHLIRKKNWQVDIRYLLSPRRHFDDEEFEKGRQIITEGLSAVKASNKRENFEAATTKLGKILHSLQDFYSHSNWVEMGNKVPNSNLIREGSSIGNIAAKSRATCRSCVGNDCRNNILEDVLQQKILTSGYFGFLGQKPRGKCSHGGLFDASSLFTPRGGINKDSFGASHGYLHAEAANLAIAATTELLEDIRGAAGDRPFLQMMGISKGKPLCFVVDTTTSMGDDIDAVRTISSSIINNKVGTEDEPSVYILVPFNDPGFGPQMKTSDPNVFKNYIKSLSASGGGDAPEMSLSGLQLVLTSAPSNSEIFVFTDAPAKDKYLKDSVIALIERTKSVVNFMITNVPGFRRRRQLEDSQQQQYSRVAASDTQLYRDLAQASGGQAIEVTKIQLLEATSIIVESTSSSLVTLLQAARSSGKEESFTFSVDESVKKLTVYITGSSVSFTLISPSGVSQESSNTGPLIITSQSVGNLRTLRLQSQVGLWEMRTTSTNPYTLKVVGESPIDFLFDFLEVSQGPFGGLDVVDNRPKAGVNGSLLVILFGSDLATVTEVTLVESSGSGQVNGTVEAQGGGEFLVRFDRIPSVEFVVLVKGQNSDTSKASPVLFQRQSTTSIRASAVTITAEDSESVLVPGTPLSVPFSVTTSGSGGDFIIQVTNDQGFDSTSPLSLAVEDGSSANGTVTITAPLNTPSGTDVTLTIEAEAPGGTDTNYVVMRLTVLTPVTDFTQPVCQLLSLQSNCSEDCSSAAWEVSVQVDDRAEGTGVSRVDLRQGNGTMNTSLAADNKNITLVSYRSSCCSPDMELLVVDGVGNIGSCFYTVRSQAVTTSSPQDPAAAGAVSLSTRAVKSFLLCISITILGLIWIH